MSRLFIVTLFTCLIIRLVSSCTTREIFNKEYKTDAESGVKIDSTIFNLPVKIDSFNLKIIPPSSGVQFYKDGIVFLSSSKYEGKMLPKHLSFGNYQACYARLEDSTLGQHLVFSPSAFPYPCEAICFTNDFDTLYFTKYSKDLGKEKIFMAVNQSGINSQPDWSEKTKPLDFCDDNYNYTHPALSVDGCLMIFASDRPGSFGGPDLYMSKKEGVTWGPPQNLGKDINTKGHELFPFLDLNNNLFYSSNGLPGFGGFDIYTCKFNGKTWDKPVNLTHLINTGNDEVAFTLSRIDGVNGFFTTKQKSRTDEMQLYSIRLKEAESTDSVNLSQVLYYLALSGTKTNVLKPTAQKTMSKVINTDSIELKRIVAEKNASAKLKSDSILLSRLETERKKAAGKKSDSIMAVRIEAERMRSAKLKSDSTKAARINAYSKEYKDIVVYKVQFLSSVNSKQSYKVSVDQKEYYTSEYFYKGAYRLTIGEFSSLKPAVELQNACRKSGLTQAFVIAFKNNERSLDPQLFK